MAKTSTVKKGFLQKLTKSQKISLILLLVLVVVLPIAVIVAQLQTRTTPHASYTVPVVTPACIGKVDKTINYLSCPKAGQYYGIVYTCVGISGNKTIKAASCTTRQDLLAKANNDCGYVCKSYPKPTVTKAPTATPTPKSVGGEKDSHGCYTSAGYAWCESTQACARYSECK